MTTWLLLPLVRITLLFIHLCNRLIVFDTNLYMFFFPSYLLSLLSLRPEGDDKFFRRASWNKDQINACVYASVPAPPVVDVNAYVVPSGGTYPRRYPWSSYLTLLLIYLSSSSSLPPFNLKGMMHFFVDRHGMLTRSMLLPMHPCPPLPLSMWLNVLTKVVEIMPFSDDRHGIMNKSRLKLMHPCQHHPFWLTMLNVLPGWHLPIHYVVSMSLCLVHANFPWHTYEDNKRMFGQMPSSCHVK